MNFKIVTCLSLLFVAVVRVRPEELKRVEPKKVAPPKTLVAKPLEPKPVPTMTFEYATIPTVVLEESKPEELHELTAPEYDEPEMVEMLPEEEVPELTETCLDDDKECQARNSS